MDSRDAVKASWDMSHMVVNMYLQDLTDEEMMHRPHAQCNHIKWQFGHLIAADNQLLESVCPGKMPALPEGFTAKYTKETSASDDPSAFDSKSELMRLSEEQSAGAEATLRSMSDEDFDKPSPEQMREYAPTVGAIFALVGSHWMMHAGQWAVIRHSWAGPRCFERLATTAPPLRPGIFGDAGPVLRLPRGWSSQVL